MIRPITIGNFKGIAPRFAGNLKPGYAVTALNCDLASTKIKPLYGAALQEADLNLYNSLCYYNSAWERGNDKYYLLWKIGNYELLIYLVSGVPMKKVGTATGTLGQTRLGAPTLALNGVGNINDTVKYMITTNRSVGGHEDESGPSTQSGEIVATNNIVRVTRPTITDTNVTYWNIYRIGDKTGEYQFVAQVAAATAIYDDDIAQEDLGDAPTTWYTSDQENSIVFDIPQTTFDGLATEPYSGILFAWKGPTLYWSEPGYPDAWPSFYSMNFPSSIKRVIPFAGSVAVLTAKGPFRVDGTHPELLQQSKVLGKEPCIRLAACHTSQGVAYLSDSGIVIFNLNDTQVISDSAFTEQWFKDHVASSGAFMIENDSQVYLFHTGGVLVVDGRTSATNWYTMDMVCYAAYVREDQGEVYVTDSAGIKKLHASGDPLTWQWRSGDITGNQPQDKPFDEVEVIGSGTVSLTLYVDGVQMASKALGFDMLRNRILRLPEQTEGRALQFELSGTGEVTEVEVRYSA